MIDLRTLGRVESRSLASGRLIDLARQPKCFATAVYLAVEDGPVQRDRLLALLWPELDEKRARAALRQLLFRIGQAGGDQVILRDGAHALRLHPGARCDAASFRSLLDARRWYDALRLYDGGFLPGFHVSGAPELERWIDGVRADLDAAAIEAAWELVRGVQARGETEAARHWARWALERAPYDEARLRDYLLLLHQAGRPLEAAASYRSFARRLKTELGISPAPETLRLLEDVLALDAVPIPVESQAPDWTHLRLQSRVFSRNTLEVVRRTSGIRWEYHAERPVLRSHVESFLDSAAVATALVAPAGYGKTVGLARTLEHLWLSDGAPHAQDILWFVRIRDLGGVPLQDGDLPAWLLAQMGLGHDVDYQEYFRAHPDRRRGRVVLVLDGLDEHSLHTEMLDGLFSQLTALVASIREPWFRVMLSMRPAAWQRFSAAVGDATAFWELWHGVGPATSSEDCINVPRLSTDQFLTVVSNVWQGENGWGLATPERTALASQEILTYPFYLQLFLQSSPEPGPVDRLGIVDRFMEHRISSPPHAADKSELLDAFLRETGYGEVQRVRADRLHPWIEDMPAAYQELVSAGILTCDEGVDGSGTPVLRIGMGQPALFEILLARHWIRAHGGVSAALLAEVVERYRGNALRLPVLSWLVREALRSGAFGALESTFRLPVAATEQRALARVLGAGLRRSEAARAFLIPRWARDPAAQVGYFETFVDQDFLVPQFMESIDTYLRHRTDRQAQVFGRALLLLGALMKLDEPACHREARRLAALAPDESIHPLPLGRAVGYLMTYHHHLRGGLPGPLLERTLRWAELTPRSGDIFRDFPAYHLHVMEALNLCGRWAETLRVAELAHSNYPRLTLYRERTTFYSAFLCHHAMALLHEGQEATARQILEELRRGPHLPDSSSYPTFHHSRIHMLRLEAESLVRTGDPPAAIERLRDVVRISRTLGCRFFEVRALGRLAALSAALGDVDAFNRAERRIDEVFSEAAFHSPGDAAHRPGPGPVHG